MNQLCSVVIIEDEDIPRKSLIVTTDWKTLDCQVIGEADNGTDGETLVRRLQPDIVITDISMPGQGGLELIRNLREDFPNIEFIIISGYAEFSYAQKAVEYGVQGYLLKPIDPLVLRDTVAKAVREISRIRDEQILLSHLRMAADFSIIKASDYRDTYFQEVVKLIETHYHEQLNLQDIAQVLALSESTLVKLFKTKTGYTFLEYLTLFRMRKATEFLRDKEKQVTEVANLVGYRDYRYFCRVFKTVFGLTPLDYKKGKMKGTV